MESEPVAFLPPSVFGRFVEASGWSQAADTGSTGHMTTLGLEAGELHVSENTKKGLNLQ